MSKKSVRINPMSMTREQSIANTLLEEPKENYPVFTKTRNNRNQSKAILGSLPTYSQRRAERKSGATISPKTINEMEYLTRSRNSLNAYNKARKNHAIELFESGKTPQEILNADDLNYQMAQSQLVGRKIGSPSAANKQPMWPEGMYPHTTEDDLYEWEAQRRGIHPSNLSRGPRQLNAIKAQMVTGGRKTRKAKRKARK
jgi:hypothetical protein